jgi:hypothetical protein
MSGSFGALDLWPFLALGHELRVEVSGYRTAKRVHMATYEHLPIFKRLMDLSVFLEQVVAHFFRYHKYTLGSELRTMCHEALALIVEANSSRERQPVLFKLRVLLERIKIHLIIAREVKAFNNRSSFGQAAEMIVDLCRQNEGWIKSMSGNVAGRKQGRGSNEG